MATPKTEMHISFDAPTRMRIDKLTKALENVALSSRKVQKALDAVVEAIQEEDEEETS